MKLGPYIQEIRSHLTQSHEDLLICFQLDETLKDYRPVDGGWTVHEILEHVSLTSHFLLILIDKGADKALRNVQERDLNTMLKTEHLNLSKLDAIGRHMSFEWIRPEHMEPTGEKSAEELIVLLKDQLQRCLNHLEQLKNGEGLLYKTTMTVNELGKLNVYEYIYFLSKHAERHIRQIGQNCLEFQALGRMVD